MTEALPERYPANRRPGVLAAVVITLLILGFGFAIFGFTAAILAALIVGMVAAYVAIPYTVLAIVVREVSARRSRRDAEPRHEGEPEHHDDAIRFRMFRQRASMTTAIAMLVALTVSVVLNGGLGDLPGSGSGSVENMSLATFGAFAAVAGVLAIVVNAPSIYSPLIVGSERHAIRGRTGAWKLILANTILTTTSWIAYCGFAIHFVTQSM